MLVNTGSQVSNLDQAKQLQWGVQGGTTSEAFLNARVQPANPARVYTETSDLVAALLARDIDAVLFDTVVVLPWSKQPGYENTEVVGQFKTGEVYGVLLAKRAGTWPPSTSCPVASRPTARSGAWPSSTWPPTRRRLSAATRPRSRRSRTEPW